MTTSSPPDSPAPPPRPVFRRAKPDDLDAVLLLADELQSQHHAAHPALFVPPGDPMSFGDPWRDVLEGDTGAIFVAELRGRIVGFVAIDVAEEAVPVFRRVLMGHVMSIAVAREWRGRGLGRALMAMAEAWAAGRGARQMKLSVWTFNEDARRLYESLGYDVRAYAMGKVLPEPGAAGGT